MASSEAQGGQDVREIDYGADLKASGGFLGGWTVDLSSSNSLTWTNKWSDTSNNTTGQTASFSVTGPAYSDHYTGPTQFNVYQDSVYNSFMFFPCGPTC